MDYELRFLAHFWAGWCLPLGAVSVPVWPIFGVQSFGAVRTKSRKKLRQKAVRERGLRGVASWWGRGGFSAQSWAVRIGHRSDGQVVRVTGVAPSSQHYPFRLPVAQVQASRAMPAACSSAAKAGVGRQQDVGTQDDRVGSTAGGPGGWGRFDFEGWCRTSI